MDTVVVVYTSLGGLIQTMKNELAQELPGYRIVNIADDSLIKEVMECNGVTDKVKKRMVHYFQAALQWNPKVIISACSSVGEVAEDVDKMLGVPVIRIDRAMIKEALKQGNRIGVLASLATTMAPTVSYVHRLGAYMGKDIQVIGKVAEGAYEANSQGQPEIHDSLIKKAAEAISDQVDVLILAQGSMAKMEGVLREVTGLPVYSSPHLCVKEVREICKEMKG